jgi:hypothetical protein
MDWEQYFKIMPYNKLCFNSSYVLRTPQQIVNYKNLNSKVDSTSVLHKESKDTPGFVAFWVQGKKLGM